MLRPRSLLGYLRLSGCRVPRLRRPRPTSDAACERLEGRTLLTAFVVNSLADGAPAADGLLTLREALIAANAAVGSIGAGDADGDMIAFAAGLSGTVTLTEGQLAIKDDVRIDGDGRVTIAAGGANRVFEISTLPGAGADRSVHILNAVIIGGDLAGGASSEGGGIAVRAASGVRLSGVAVTGGRAERGGGIFNAGSLVLHASWVHGNSAAAGGGIFNAGGSLEVVVSTVGAHRGETGLADQTADEGGGVYSTGGAVTVDRSVVINNAADRGGGIAVLAGRLRLDGSVVGENAAGRGGGVYVAGPDVEAFVFRTRIDANRASEGGGVWIAAGSPVLVNESIVSRNSAHGELGDVSRGGGIFNDGSDLRLGRSVVTTNVASGGAIGGGGGIYSDGGSVFAYETTIHGNHAHSRNHARSTGGGVEVVAGRVVLDHSEVVGNSAEFGGGLRASGEGAAAVVHRSDVRGNAAYVEGGGLWIQAGGTLTVDRSYVRSNRVVVSQASDAGGGIFNAGRMLLAASVVTGNQAANEVPGNSSKEPSRFVEGAGGGIYTAAGGVSEVRDLAQVFANRPSDFAGPGAVV